MYSGYGRCHWKCLPDTVVLSWALNGEAGLQAAKPALEQNVPQKYSPEVPWSDHSPGFSYVESRNPASNPHLCIPHMSSHSTPLLGARQTEQTHCPHWDPVMGRGRSCSKFAPQVFLSSESARWSREGQRLLLRPLHLPCRWAYPNCPRLGHS